MRRSVLRVVWLGALAWSAAALADQYSYLGFKVLNGPQNPFRYYVDARNSKPAGIELTEVEKAVQGAFNAWQQASRGGGTPCASIGFQYAGRSTTTNIPDVGNPYDQFNVSAVWITSRTDPRYKEILQGGNARAVAVPVDYDGILYQCDIVLNGTGDVRWSTLSPTPAGYLDLQSYLVHEVGHCLGLGHTSDVADTVMYGLDLDEGESRRNLFPHDVEHLCRLYPVSGVVGAFCPVANTCGAGFSCVTVDGSGPAAGVRMCTRACTGATPGECPAPYVCRNTTALPGASKACLPPDANSSTQVGKACNNANECGSGYALCQQEVQMPSGNPAWAKGYCTQSCNAGEPACPNGSTCAAVGNSNRCLQDCRPGTADCRPGHVCATRAEGNLCIPACYIDADCGSSSFACRVCDNICAPRQQATSTLGDTCTSNANCGTGQVCLKSPNSSPADTGVCSQSCSLATCSCPSGSTCQQTPGGYERMCIRTCDPGTCSPGLQCAPLATGGKGCVPRCRSQADCVNGTLCGADGTCVDPNTTPDAGTCTLCGNDGGVPPPPPPPDGGTDGGTGGGGTGPSCGCTGAPSLSGLWALLALGLLARGRNAWLRR